MSKIIQFKQPKPKKKKIKKKGPRELSITKAFDKIDERWHKNEKEYTDIWRDFSPHDKRYWREKLSIWKARLKLLKKITTKTELKREIKTNITNYEKDFRAQIGAYHRFISALKKYDK